MRKGECYGAGIGNGIGAKGNYDVLYVAAPMLGLSLLVGLAVSIFQATTQIQEQLLLLY